MGNKIRKLSFESLISYRLLMSDIGKYLENYIQEIGLDIKSSQIFILFALYRKKDITQESIANFYGYDRATTGRILEKMKKVGLLARERNKEDNRKWDLKLTEKGNEYAKFLEEKIDEWYFALVGEEDYQNLNFEEYLKVLAEKIYKKG